MPSKLTSCRVLAPSWQPRAEPARPVGTAARQCSPACRDCDCQAQRSGGGARSVGVGLTFGNMDRRFRMRADVCSGVGIDVSGPAASPAGAAVTGFRRISSATVAATSTQLATNTGTGRYSDWKGPLLYMTARRRVQRVPMPESWGAPNKLGESRRPRVKLHLT